MSAKFDHFALKGGSSEMHGNHNFQKDPIKHVLYIYQHLQQVTN